MCHLKEVLVVSIPATQKSDAVATRFVLLNDELHITGKWILAYILKYGIFLHLLHIGMHKSFWIVVLVEGRNLLLNLFFDKCVVLKSYRSIMILKITNFAEVLFNFSISIISNYGEIFQPFASLYEKCRNCLKWIFDCSTFDFSFLLEPWKNALEECSQNGRICPCSCSCSDSRKCSHLSHYLHTTKKFDFFN